MLFQKKPQLDQIQVDPLVDELDREATATHRVLQRLSDDVLDWKPGDTSWTLGQLATHVARIPGAFARTLSLDEIEVGNVTFEQIPLASAVAILEHLGESVGAARKFLEHLDSERAAEPFRVLAHGRTVFVAPRIAMVRTLMLNHWYHHRGQLLVYYRLAGIPVPAVYGPSGDESPFETGVREGHFA